MKRLLLAAASGLVALATLAAPTAASAAPLSPVDRFQFQAELTVAITASGAFAAGQLLRHEMLDINSRIPAEKRGVDQVNADGSLILQRTGAGRTWQVRCVARDQCWERVLGKLSDRRWHALPAGAINYIQATADTEVASIGFWPPEATFDSATNAAGAQVLTARYPASDGVNVDAFIVSPARSERAITRERAGKRDERLLEITFESIPTPIAVAPPPRKQIGRPATLQQVPPGGFRLSFRVRINAPA